MRPESHREQVPDKRCGTCFFAIRPYFKDDLLCFHGDNIEVNHWRYPAGDQQTHTDVFLDGEDVGIMDGEEYSKVWGGRVVDYTDICDEYLADGGIQ